jgi:hypothetical protein
VAEDSNVELVVLDLAALGDADIDGVAGLVVGYCGPGMLAGDHIGGYCSIERASNMCGVVVMKRRSAKYI